MRSIPVHLVSQDALQGSIPVDIDDGSADEDDDVPESPPSSPEVICDTGSDESETEDILTREQLDEFHNIRRELHAVKLTVNEIWACLVAIKIRLGYPDFGLLLFAELFNIAARKTGTGLLPPAELLKNCWTRSFRSRPRTWHFVQRAMF